MASAWLYILGGGIVTFAWRALGVLLSGRIDPESRAMRWVACVAYALLAGLIARLIVLPQGMLAETAPGARLAAAAAALIAYRLARGGILSGVAAGTATLMLLVYLT